MDLQSIRPIEGFHFIGPDQLHWRPSNLMGVLNADFLERTGSELLGARLWRVMPGQANTLHRHRRSEEFYFVVEGTGRIRIAEETLTVPAHSGVLVGPKEIRQIYNDTTSECLWLIANAPEVELEESEKGDLTLYYPSDPKSLPEAILQQKEPKPFSFKEHAAQWIETWNSRDLDRILAMYAEEIVFESPLIPRIMGTRSALLRGKAALAEYFRKGLAAYPDLHFTLLEVFAGAQSCVLRYEAVNKKIGAETHLLGSTGQIVRTHAHYAV